MMATIYLVLSPVDSTHRCEHGGYRADLYRVRLHLFACRNGNGARQATPEKRRLRDSLSLPSRDWCGVESRSMFTGFITRRASMKKTSTFGIIAIAAFFIALVLTLIFGAALWDVGGDGTLQGLGGWLKLPMAIFTFLGDEQFFLLLVPLVYWCLNKELGADLGVLLVLSSSPTPRSSRSSSTAGRSGRPRRCNWASQSFSPPSGHAQTSAALFGYLAWFVADKPRGRLWAALLGLLWSSSRCRRVYLGVHFLGDILWGRPSGWPGGALRLGEAEAVPRLKLFPLGIHVLLAFVAAAFIFVVVSLLLAIPFGTGQMFGPLYTDAWRSALKEAATSQGWRSACGSAWRWRSASEVRCGRAVVAASFALRDRRRGAVRDLDGAAHDLPARADRARHRAADRALRARDAVGDRGLAVVVRQDQTWDA